MGLLDNLKSIFHIDNVNLSDIKLINNKSNNKIEYVDKRTIINIGAVDFTEDNATEFKKFLKDYVSEDGLILKEEAQKKVELIRETEETDENKKLLTFFTGKLPHEDFEILRASLVVRTEFKNRSKSVADLKQDISQRYGLRGRNIVNLCTAGYFDSVIKPLYEEMEKKPNFSIELFHQRYNVIVMQSPFAVFVNSVISDEELEQNVRSKIEQNKKYGIKSLNIHGLGETNVLKITNLLIKIKDIIDWPPEIENDKGYITVTIYY